MVTVMCGIGWLGVFISLMEGSRLGMQGNMTDLVSLAWKGALWIVIPVVSIVILGALWIGSAQLILSVGNPRRMDPAKTAECFGYAWGACFLMAVPCFGFYMIPFALIWVAVSAVVQLCVRQEVGASRAVWAVLTLPLVFILGVAAWIALMIAFVK
jgi:hypothetical protein